MARARRMSFAKGRRQVISEPQFDENDRVLAWTAIQRLRQMLPQLRHFAREVTRNPKVEIRVSHETPHTTGNLITIRPPLGLGKSVDHVRSECGKRGLDSRQICEACHLREVIDFFLFHEIAHIAFETQDEINKHDIDTALAYVEDWHPTGACSHGGFMRSHIRHESKDVMGMCVGLNDYLPMIVNCLEDSRVNARMFDARPGLRVVFEQNLERLMTEGSEIGSEKFTTWKDRPLDAQFMVGLSCLSGGGIPEDTLHEDVMTALADDKILRICERVVSAESVHDIFELSMEAFRRAQELGFCVVEKCSVAPPSPPGLAGEDGPGSGTPVPDGDASESDESEQSDSGSIGGGDDSASAEGDTDASAADERDQDTGADERDSSPTGTDGQESGSEANEGGSDSGGEDSADESSGQDSSAPESDGEQSGRNESGGAPSDDDAASDEESNSSDTPGSGGEDKEDELAEGSGGKQDTDSISNNGSLESSENQDDSNDPQNDAESSVRRDDESIDGGEDCGEDSGDSGPEDAESLTDSEDELEADTDSLDAEDSPPVVEPHNPWDTEAPSDPGNGAVGTPFEAPNDPVDGSNVQTPDHGTPEDIARVMSKVLMHGGEDDGGMLDEIAGMDHEELVGTSEDKELPDHIRDLIIIALMQVSYFDTASTRVVGVDEVKFPNSKIGWRRDLDWKDFASNESLIGGAVLHARRVFDANQRSKMERNRKTGKIATRVLAKRAPVGDPRIFGKKVIPAKRSYHVLIGGDCSGSTELYERNAKIKRAMMGQGDLLTRLGITWEGYFHSAAATPSTRFSGFLITDELYLYILPFKKANEPWNDAAKNKMANVLPVSENIDGHTIEYYRKQLECSQATDKILIYYTDGAMPAANYDEEKEILEREIEICKRKGIHLFAVGINTNSPTQYGLDTVQVDSDEDIIKVINHLGDLLT